MTKSWSILRDHIYYNMCDKDDTKFNWFMTWMAHIVQKPAEKYGMAVVVTGAEGSGKSTVFDYLYAILPTGHFHYSSIRGFSSKFNSELKNNRLVMFEDSMDNFTKDAAFIKRLVTEDTLYIESKGADVIEIPNYLRLVLLTQSNEIKVPCERRFVQLKMSTKPEYAQYFEHIWCQMQGGGSEVFKEELENWVPPQEDGWDCLRRAPEEEEPYAVFDIETRGIEDDSLYATGGVIKPIQYFAYQQEAFDAHIKETLIYKTEEIAKQFTFPDKPIWPVYTIETKLPKINWGILGEKPGWIKNSIIDEALSTTHKLYGPQNWTAEELIHCVDSNGTAYLAEQNNWNESDVTSWYEDATTEGKK